ncbi:MAG: hypothetical protein RIR54_540 [Actinomycetota bacterium]
MVTRRRDTVRGSCHHAQHARTSKVALYFDVFGFDGLTRQGVVDEHHSTVIVTRERISPGDEALDAQLASCADSGFGAAHRHRP